MQPLSDLSELNETLAVRWSLIRYHRSTGARVDLPDTGVDLPIVSVDFTTEWQD